MVFDDYFCLFLIDQAKLAFERVPIPQIYHPFICGPDSQTIKELMEMTGARITVPPHAVLKDEIVISGEKEGVQKAKQTILHIYDEKVILSAFCIIFVLLFYFTRFKCKLVLVPFSC